jgi:N-dimethylarginine dimethylaminohydrolase
MREKTFLRPVKPVESIDYIAFRELKVDRERLNRVLPDFYYSHVFENDADYLHRFLADVTQYLKDERVIIERKMTGESFVMPGGYQFDITKQELLDIVYNMIADGRTRTPDVYLRTVGAFGSDEMDSKAATVIATRKG